jgi:hypothetical protein
VSPGGATISYSPEFLEEKARATGTAPAPEPEKPKGKAGPGRGHKKDKNEAPAADSTGTVGPEHEVSLRVSRSLEEECLIAAYRSGMALQGQPVQLAEHVRASVAALRAPVQGAA